MGADFIYTTAPQAVFDNHNFVMKFEQIEHEIFERIMDDEYVQRMVADMLFDRDVSEMGEESWWRAIEIIGDHFYVMVNPPRDCAVISLECRLGHPTRNHVITGGVSWGDDPTDSYESVHFFNETCLLDMPFRAAA